SPGGEELASGSEDGSVRVWDAASGEERRVLSGSGGRVLSVCWSPGGEELASGSEDGSVRVWDAASGEELALFSSLGQVALAAVAGGWFRVGENPDPESLRRLLRLWVGRPGATASRGWQVLPMAGLVDKLHSPEKVRAALAGEKVEPPGFLVGKANP
ncbi:MAG: hypothetical protein SX243_25095, partial [Acidobacteriota bacterium]|nr:hypothetical protein [Acidobacteriota bacterium]